MHDPENPENLDERGVFEARYLAFLETISHLRPSLHRFCTRMTGSVLDGEDVVQDALFLAYRKLDTFDDSRPLAPWLFRIAHNSCIDFLRRRNARQFAEAEAAVPDSVEPVEPPGPALTRAVEHLVLTLPPKERACVLLKDVFDYSLEEIAELVDSTVGGVKAALNRGRTKLAAAVQSGIGLSSAQEQAGRSSRQAARAANADMASLLQLYVDRFNRRDWAALRELIADDARLRVADRFAGPLTGSPYFSRYDRWSILWHAAVGEIDGELAIVILSKRNGGDVWTPHTVVRIEARDHRIQRIADFTHCPWVMAAAPPIVINDLSSTTRPDPPSTT